MTNKYSDEQMKQWLESRPKKPVDAKVIMRSTEGKILLVKTNYKDTWQLIGGGIEDKEDPKDGARREIKEEVNADIDPENLRIVGTVYRPKQDHLFLVYEYTKLIDENNDYSVDDKEIEAYKFFAPSDVTELIPEYYRNFWRSYI